MADLEDRCADLRHLSMHNFVGRAISPTGKGTRMYHHSLYTESKSKFLIDTTILQTRMHNTHKCTSNEGKACKQLI